ncbi:hypothetical protein ACFCX0_38080 [Streptomyces sp. NPDC056352]|uniref:hypothetical protein n=1 Tax=Streptomyces sp. NPDC056352 TaxID=3345791 RepID=UPI0035D6AEBF
MAWKRAASWSVQPPPLDRPLLLEQGVELVAIKELLGHVSVGVYAHVRLRLERQAINTLGDVLGRPTTTPTTHPPQPSSADDAVSAAVKTGEQ